MTITEDFNARTGIGNNNTKRTVGQFAIDERCSNGNRIINFAATNQLMLSNTRFQLLRCHLLTQHSPPSTINNQINHTLIKSRWVLNVLDCQVYREAKKGNKNNYGHVMVRVNLRPKLKVNKKFDRFTKYDISNKKKLEIFAKQEYQKDSLVMRPKNPQSTR